MGRGNRGLNPYPCYGPRYTALQRESVRELVLEAGEHHVVIRGTLAAERIDAVYQRVQRGSHDRSLRVCIVVVNEMLA